MTFVADGVHVTFRSLAYSSDPSPAGVPDRFEIETIEILKRVSRRPIDPAPDSELLADLGFDSLQVLELVGELEDRFEVAVPLNDLTHIRTVREIADEIRKLHAEGGVRP